MTVRPGSGWICAASRTKTGLNYGKLFILPLRSEQLKLACMQRGRGVPFALVLAIASLMQPSLAVAGTHHAHHASKKASPIVRQVGQASWYGAWHAGRTTANGESFNPHALTAALPTLPMNSEVKVRNLRNGRTVTVRINDRLPPGSGRIIDLSQQAAAKLGIEQRGHARVMLEALYIPKK